MFSQTSDGKDHNRPMRAFMAWGLALGIMGGTLSPESLAQSISAAVSRKAHGTVNLFDIDVKTAGAVECRGNGPTQVIVTFNQTIQGVGGLDPTDVVLTSGAVSSLSINGSELTINMTGATNAQPLTIAFPGIANASGMAVTDTLCFGVLAGDVNASRAVNAFDLTSVRAQLGQPVGPSNFQRDVNCTDTLNAFDLTFVRARLGTQVADCPPIALIPAGQFQMGDTFSEGSTNELPVHAVYVDAFFIDSTEVTNQQYADALNWAKNQGNLITVTSGVVYKYNSGTNYPYCDTTTSNSFSRITWDGSTFGVVSGKENHPMVMVSWYGSVAYANWRSAIQGRPLCYDLSTWECNWVSGYRLPTEAEWEKAARGGVAGHRFPWSDTDTIQHARANYNSLADYAYDTSPTRGLHPTFNTGVVPYTSPVGYFAPNGYGLYDMAGNVFEWCNDWWSSSYYSSSPYNNPHGPVSGTYRVIRGGSWIFYAYRCRVADRYFYSPGTRFYVIGFRLALDSP